MYDFLSFLLIDLINIAETKKSPILSVRKIKYLFIKIYRLLNHFFTKKFKKSSKNLITG